ncbi:exonuclease [Escherichia coli]|nr:exonuclease [Escherichia coli]EFN4034198.1 exonuclease [Escherichia coli]EFN4038987.1 exonuclease [Escherichia coli]EFN6070281.1 exonuclease [Escherichia coli]
MSAKPLFLLRKAKKSSGEPDVVLWASDDFESTCATLDYLIVKSGKKLSSYFKAVATNFPVVNDLPPEGEIDFTWSERYQLSKDSMTWELKPGAAPDDAHHQENAQETEELTGGHEENTLAGAHGDCPDCEVSVATLRFTQRLLHIFTYAAGDRKYLHHATREQREHITALEMDQENSYVQNLLLAIRGMAEPATLDNAALLRLTDAIKAVFSITKKHQPYEFKNFISAWLNTEHIDRGLLTKEWRKGNRVSHITRTASGANAGGGNLTDRGDGFVHDQASLARDVATGVLARSMDVDIYNLHPAHAKRVEEIIAENKPPFSVFRDKFITMPGGLDYSRAIVVASVKEAPIGIEVIPAHVTEYLNKVLTETDHANPDPEIVDIACGRSSSPMPQRVTEEGKHDGEEKPQPSGAMADEQATPETMEPDATEHHQDSQPLDAQSQVNPVDAEYQKKRAELHEARKNIPPKNPVDADKLLAASRGEFVEGISDPNDPKWVKGIQPRDSVYQNQPETEKTSPDMNQPEPVVQQEPEIACNACGQTGGDNCPECGAVMGDATYQETFDDKNQVEVQEDDSEKMEGAEHPHKENAGSAQDHASDSETGETADPLIKVNGHHVITSTSRTCDHLMIDLETMGKNPDAPIISIGAIFFDPQTGDMGPEFSKTIDLNTAGGVIDRDVIKWWLKQSREAQSAIMTDEIPLDDALLQLREFIDENSGEFFVQVWGNGANFDNTILRRSYERQGIPCPWRYYNDRDVRTIVELGKAIDFDARTAIPFEGERHNALDDARYQAKYVSVIWQKLIPSQADS